MENIMGFEYNIAAIPTVYKGQTFRSRLEAKWAAFFDLLEWEWVYEPFDFGGWSPDFAIRAPGAGSPQKIVLAEVKPIMSLEGNDDIMDKMINSCPYYIKTNSMNLSYRVPEYELLLLGLSPTEDVLGWFQYHSQYCKYGYSFGEAIFGLWNNKIGFCPDAHECIDRISGGNEDGYPITRSEFDFGSTFIMDIWGQACATVQWQPSRQHYRRVG